MKRSIQYAVILTLALFAARVVQAAGFICATPPTSVVFSGATTPQSITLTGVTAGDLVILVAEVYQTVTVSSVSDGGDTVINPVAWGAVQQANAGIYAAVSSAGGSVTWTIGFSSNASGTLQALDCTGNAAAGSELDAATVWTGGTTVTTASSNPLTPANSGELAVAVVEINAGKTVSWQNGYTEVSNATQGSNTFISVATQVLSGTSSITATANWSGGSSYQIAQVLFVPASGGSSCTHYGQTAAGTLAIPNGTSGSYLGKTGAFVTPDCSTIEYKQPKIGNFGKN